MAVSNLQRAFTDQFLWDVIWKIVLTLEYDHKGFKQLINFKLWLKKKKVYSRS